MNPTNLRKGRSTTKLHGLVPSSNMHESSPAEAKLIDRVPNEAAAMPGCAIKNRKALTPPTKRGAAIRDKCNR